jgi:hypothetical protein
MNDEDKLKRAGSYVSLVIGVLGSFFAAQEIVYGLLSNNLVHVSPKHGLTFYGVPALVIQVSWLALSVALAILGWYGSHRK